MADWTNIADTALDPDAPLTSELAYAWRDNPIAIAEGAAGAPRIADAAMGLTPTTAGRDWVLERQALSAAGAVGTYAFAVAPSADLAFGATTLGSGLSAASVASSGGGPLSGTWRCMGRIEAADPNTSRKTLFLRIA